MKDIRGTTYKELIEKTKIIIGKEYKRHAHFLDDLSMDEKQYFNSIILGNCDEAGLSSSLDRLTYFLYKLSKKRVAILLDEYDSPIEDAYENKFYDEGISFFDNFTVKD